MTTELLFACLALATLGLVLLVVVFRALLRATTSVWLTATVLLTIAVLWFDIVIIWCLVEYSLFNVDFSREGLRALIEHAAPGRLLHPWV